MSHLPLNQREILRRLALAAHLRYSELQPDDVDGNLHTYHLKSLMAAGLVEKVDGGYALSTEGRRFVGTMSTSTGEKREQPKVTTMLSVKNAEGQYVLFRWNKQPFLGKVSLPYGKVHLGESIFAAAVRELDEKTGITAATEDLEYRGTIFIRSFEGDVLLNHMESHVFSLEYSGEIIQEAALGECFWGTLGEIPTDERCPGFGEVMELLEGGKAFFSEV